MRKMSVPFLRDIVRIVRYADNVELIAQITLRDHLGVSPKCNPKRIGDPSALIQVGWL